MKVFSFHLISLAMAFFALLYATPSFAQFQREFGTAFDNSFSKVIKSGTDYYVLGQDQPTAGGLSRATVTRLDACGQQQWTLSLDIASTWNDAVLTPTVADAESETIIGTSDPFVAQLADVTEAIRDGRAPLVALGEGAATLRLALAARQSADECREIRLTDAA